MLKECFYHGTRNSWAYAYDRETIHLRVRTKRDDVGEIVAFAGDKYDWASYHREYAMEKVASDNLFDYWQVGVKPRFKRLSYIFCCKSGSETVWVSEGGFYPEQPEPPEGYYDFPYLHEADMFKVPDWVKEAVFYQIIVDRFANGNPAINPDPIDEWGAPPTESNFFGGDLQGVMEHLDYLSELGVNAIYFTPLFAAPSNHKYDTMDYKQVDPHYGDNEQLRALVDACHERGIRVMLDAVFNHCGEHFPPFQDVKKKGPYSPYADWFHINEYPVEVRDGIPTYDTFGFFAHMPKFNTANPEVKKYLLDVAEYWIKELKLDGWRLDVANEVDHQFWREFRRVVKQANPDAYIVGEVWSDSLTWLLGDQFDSVMNYPFSGKVLEFFSGDTMDGLAFSQSIGQLLMRYPQQTNEVIFNLLCSHDTPRALTVMKGDKRRLKLAVVFLFTYTGTPCIFYGDEIGLQGGGDPECRVCMQWDPDKQDRELLQFYKDIIHLRRTNPALQSGRFHFLQAAAGKSYLIYERRDSEKQFTIWINNSPLPAELTCQLETDGWRDALTMEEVGAEGGVMTVRLDAFGYRILVRELS
ncbi:Glycosidase [Paenibacillus sp. UNCCL117]|uniref:alpha-glycosidase n=1 Tax=unclassified Paenibacillus TaxID=185978 RepID=UPI0008921692|nr:MULTISPECIES: alpha-glycosidase [unclassified Paenibacillus]SDC64151.1 Glycosidase [Paenibacillus sp. cl123]SFW22463.1 Glycosidase [Paenibacillus sp. UNCCL117]